MRHMVRKNFYIDARTNVIIKNLPGATPSEHIRRAIDEYVERMYPKMMASTSPSVKGVDMHE